MNKYKNTINRILKVSMILGLVPISIMGATGGMVVGTSVPVTDASGTSKYTHSVPISQRVWKGINAVINALCCFSGPTRVEEPVSLGNPVVDGTVPIIATVVPTIDRPTLTNECQTLITNLGAALNDYFILESLELTLPNSRDTRFDEVLKVAIMLSKAECICDFLQNQQANLSDSEINSFNEIYNAIKSEYSQMIVDKNRSIKVEAWPIQINSHTNHNHTRYIRERLVEGNRGNMAGPVGNFFESQGSRVYRVISCKINNSLREIDIKHIVEEDRKYTDYCTKTAYRILLRKLGTPDGVYSINVLGIDKMGPDSWDGLECIFPARQYHRMVAYNKIGNKTEVDQDIQKLYKACMSTYTIIPDNEHLDSRF